MRVSTNRRTPGLNHLADTLRAALHEVDAHAGGLYLYDPDKTTLALSLLVGVPRDLFLSWTRIAPTARVPVNDAIRERQVVWRPNGAAIGQDYPRVSITLPYDFSVAVVPLVSGREEYGAYFTFGVADAPAELSARARAALTGAADRIVEQLREARDQGHPVRPPSRPRVVDPASDDQGQGGPEENDAIARMVRPIREGLCALDVDGRITTVTDAAADLLGRPRERLLGYRPWTALPWLRDPVFEDRYRAAIVSHQPVQFTALCPPDRWLSFHLYPGGRGVSVVITPTDVDRRGKTARGRRTPTRAGELYHILHLASALTEAVTVDDVVDLVAREILPAVGANGLALFRNERREQRLRLLGERGFDPAVLERVDGAPLDRRAPITHAAASGVPGFFRSRVELELVYPEIPHRPTGPQGWAILPLIASGRPIGVCVLTFPQPHVFTVQRRAVLNALSSLIAQALERARLYDFKMHLAQGLQSVLLPRRMPDLPGLNSAYRYLPGTEGMDIGGDFYDQLPLGPSTSTAIIGDVQGHSVSAAALMGQIRTAALAFTTVFDGDPGQVLTHTNRLLCQMESDLFTSCVHLRLDMRTGRVRMARAGHPEPLLSAPGGGRVMDVPDGLLLGIDPEAEYPVLEFDLPPRSILALYTDGLIETPGADLDEAKRDVLSCLDAVRGLPLDEVAEEMVARVRTEHREDDIALLLLESAPLEKGPSDE
ncbi:SpoIIE family protein phosphatase [Nocardiopsis aegyptia]|uniref:Serine phosphatase RsbU (Regulator of sigma subunit)/PAS domain-containing protein n=1 Tax=Nocardiopsis aegyptia TaxID=220378 RepID=A0A7Z0ENG2_9ACTN|nr:SpoIIE family protein phosphatase [Nocardiopsis aegyptia]NYJ34498.1 serine phosphatase RsbU (regulator of sigma subunit)/PAS domain-containing protein [Nocardiopsis aegyptia]